MAPALADRHIRITLSYVFICLSVGLSTFLHLSAIADNILKFAGIFGVWNTRVNLKDMRMETIL